MQHRTTIAVLLLVASHNAAGQTAQCRLAPRPYGFGGICRVEQPAVGSQPLRIPLPDTLRIWTTSGPADPPPWRGNLSWVSSEVAFEIASATSRSMGVSSDRLTLRTGVFWLPVKEWRQIDPAAPPCAACERLAKDVWLVLDLVNPVPASEDDLAILRTALSRLDTLTNWNRDEAQTCGTMNQLKTGLFCLLYSGVEARMGRYHHRQPALEFVRSVILERWRDRITSHPLVDFNNHPATTMGDLRTVVRAALDLAAAEARPPKE